MSQPVCEKESGVFGEVAVVEDEEEFCAVGGEALEGVGVARGKAVGSVNGIDRKGNLEGGEYVLPKIAFFEVVDEAAAFGIKSSDTHTT